MKKCLNITAADYQKAKENVIKAFADAVENADVENTIRAAREHFKMYCAAEIEKRKANYERQQGVFKDSPPSDDPDSLFSTDGIAIGKLVSFIEEVLVRYTKDEDIGNYASKYHNRRG